MPNKKHLQILKQGVGDWNAWRRDNPEVVPDLREALITNEDLRGADLSRAHLNHGTLVNTDLSSTTLVEADLRWMHITRTNLQDADLTRANLDGSDLYDANLSRTMLVAATFRGASLFATDLSGSILNDANFTLAKFGDVTLGNNDLSVALGLHDISHRGPSSIGIDTLFMSQGHIPEAFLRGVGVPEEFITQIPGLVASVKPIQFQSCFISYSHQDEEFAKRLHAAMRAESLRVWFAPEDMKAGRKLHEEIFRAIQIHDKLLLVLSEDSMKSEWVMTEIRRAKKVEREENRRKLFPIRLVDFETIQKWECFDADSGKDLAAEVREYYIPDFSNWKDHDSFEREFAKLLSAFRATEK